MMATPDPTDVPLQPIDDWFDWHDDDDDDFWLDVVINSLVEAQSERDALEAA